MLYEDRSSMEADWRCGMERYWLTEYRPAGEEGEKVGGIVPTTAAFDLALGSAFADGVAALTQAELSDADCIHMASTGMMNWGRSSLNLLQGMLWGAALHSIPRIMQEYDFVAAEPEHHYYWPNRQAPQIVIMTRPDLVLVRKSDQTGWVPDWKTTSYKDEKWLLQWPMAIQMHIQAAAVKQARPDLNIQGAIVLGAYKGYVNDYAGERMSPFIFAYTTMLNGKRAWSPKFVRGWDRVSVDEYPGGIAAWVAFMKTTYPVVLGEQFPVSQPIFLRQDMLDLVMGERVARLARFADWRAAGRTMPAPSIFDHRTSGCVRCGYRAACWNAPTTADPLAHGLYVRRLPNHAMERVAFAIQPGVKTLTPPPPTVIE